MAKMTVSSSNIDKAYVVTRELGSGITLQTVTKNVLKIYYGNTLLYEKQTTPGTNYVYEAPSPIGSPTSFDGTFPLSVSDTIRVPININQHSGYVYLGAYSLGTTPFNSDIAIGSYQDTALIQGIATIGPVHIVDEDPTVEVYKNTFRRELYDLRPVFQYSGTLPQTSYMGAPYTGYAITTSDFTVSKTRTSASKTTIIDINTMIDNATSVDLTACIGHHMEITFQICEGLVFTEDVTQRVTVDFVIPRPKTNVLIELANIETSSGGQVALVYGAGKLLSGGLQLIASGSGVIVRGSIRIYNIVIK